MHRSNTTSSEDNIFIFICYVKYSILRFVILSFCRPGTHKWLRSISRITKRHLWEDLRSTPHWTQCRHQMIRHYYCLWLRMKHLFECRQTWLAHFYLKVIKNTNIIKCNQLTGRNNFYLVVVQVYILLNITFYKWV